jgi:Ca-activated chloride channel family protein
MNRLLAPFIALLASLLLLAGCDGGTETPGTVAPTATLTVLAGSELKDLTDPALGNLAAQILKDTGVKLEFTFSGSLDAVDRITAGESYDTVWVSHGKYLALIPGVKEKIRVSEKTMLSPVILALKQSKAKALGWENNPDVTWREIAKAAEAGKISLAITNPASSNTGFVSMVGLAAALADKGDALTVADIKTERLAGFYKAQKLTSGSSGWLAEAYERDQNRLDGIINYESVILLMNTGSKLNEKLVPIYPKEGIITADYPMMLLNDGKRAIYDKVVAYVRDAPFQQALMTSTLRRPVNPAVPLAPTFPKALLVELPFPGSLEVIDALLAKFLSDIRNPGSAFFVVDTSGSMANGNPSRMDMAKSAMLGLLGDDTSTTGRFARFQAREHIHLMRFSNRVEPTRRFELGTEPAKNRKVLIDLRGNVEQLAPNGGTALYVAVARAYREALAVRTANPGRYVTIVVLTDGQNTENFDLEDFRKFHQSLSADARTIKVFPILFGEGNVDEMTELARMTGGRTFDARKHALAVVFKDIRGYQ